MQCCYQCKGSSLQLLTTLSQDCHFLLACCGECHFYITQATFMWVTGWGWNMSSCKTMSEVLVRKWHESSLLRDVHSGFSLGLRCLCSVFPRCTAHPQKDAKPCKQTNLMFHSTIFLVSRKFSIPLFLSLTSLNSSTCDLTGNKRTCTFVFHFLLDYVVTLK